MDINNEIKQPEFNSPPLSLSPNAIKEFQSVYFNEYKVKISPREANMLGLKLLRFFAAIYKPIKKNDYAK